MLKMMAKMPKTPETKDEEEDAVGNSTVQTRSGNGKSKAAKKQKK